MPATAIRKRKLAHVPAIGASVTPHGKSRFVADLMGLIGKVVEVLDGCKGPIIAVQFSERPNQTYDLFWKRLRIVK